MLAPIGYATADAAARALPTAAANAIALSLARLAFALRLPARSALERNLTRVIATRAGLADPIRCDPNLEPVATDVRKHAREGFEQFALSVADFLRLSRIGAEALRDAIEVRGAEHLADARAAGRGVILLSAHLGSWEWGAAYLGALGERVRIVARPHQSRWVEAFYQRRRERWNVTRLCGRPLWLAAAQALRRGEWIALMGDRAPGSGHGDSGRDLGAWAAALARRTGATLLPAFMVRLGDGRHAAFFDPPLSPQACLDGDYRAAMRRHLERHPGQWAAFEPTPEGAF